MNFEQFQKSATRTMAELCSTRKSDLHMFLGMLTELGELADIFKKELAYKQPKDIVNIKEELGDFMWYVANYCSINSFDMANCDGVIFPDGHKQDVKAHHAIDGNFSELAIMELTKGVHQLFDGRFMDGLLDILAQITMLCIVNDIDLEECFDLNINKLKVRFPEKFTEANALNRDLEAERTILES